MINQFIFIGLLVVIGSHTLHVDSADVSAESDVSVESTEETILSATSPVSVMIASQKLVQQEMFNKAKYDNMKSQTNNIKKPFVQHLQPVASYFYPAMIPSHFFRTSSYQPAYYQPHLMPIMSHLYPLYPTQMTIMSPLYPKNLPSARDDVYERQPFPVDDELSEEEAIKELEAIKREMADDTAAQRHLSRLVLPSISVNREESSVTVSIKNFASLLRSLSSRVTLTLATRTILVPSVSIRN